LKVWFNLLLALVAAFAASVPAAATEPLQLQPGPHLFLDNFLIASSSNVVRKPVTLVRESISKTPLLTAKEHHTFQPFFTVLRDAGSGIFRLWYGIPTEDLSHVRSRFVYTESKDGIRWTNAQRFLGIGPVQFGTSVIDEGPGFLDRSQRYKLGWYMDGGLMIATSPDGFKWRPVANHVVIAHSHDINGIFYDPLRRRYTAMLSFYETGEKWTGQRRITKQAVSTNVLNWSQPSPVLLPDDRDEGETQFYAMDGFLTRGDLIIGMVKVLRDDLKADQPPVPPDAYGIGYTTLAWTRDGRQWTRERTPFLDRNSEPGTWDHAHAWIDEQVPVEDEVYLYYGGYRSGHKVNRFQERQVGLIKMKRDRYVGQETTSRGTLSTKPLLLSGKKLFVNADASRGELRVQVLTAEGKPIDGLTTDDGEPIRTDAVRSAVHWQREFPATPVILEFTFEKAVLYGFELE
jgi:hypothetical protein